MPSADQKNAQTPDESLAQFWSDTLQARRQNPADKSLVAPSVLRKYQGATTWPRSGKPLRAGLLEAAKPREFSRVQANPSMITGPLCILWTLVLSLMVTIIVLSCINDAETMPSNPDEEQDSLYKGPGSVLPYICFSMFWLAMLACCCFCWATHDNLKSHVTVLHLLHLEDTVAIVRGSTSVVHSVRVGNYEHTLLGNGDVLETYHKPAEI